MKKLWLLAIPWTLIVSNGTSELIHNGETVYVCKDKDGCDYLSEAVKCLNDSESLQGKKAEFVPSSGTINCGGQSQIPCTDILDQCGGPSQEKCK